MGTKSNPSKFDCYSKVLPDEPIFVLRAKDPAASYLVLLWTAMRRGQWDYAVRILGDASLDAGIRARISDEYYDKLQEAVDVAMQMRLYVAPK